MLNRLVIQGRLTRDPELKKTASGRSVCTISLACERDVKDQTGAKGVDYIDVISWNKLADTVMDHTRKGQMVVAEGRLQISEWDDKALGQRRRKAELNALNIYFLDKKEPKAKEDATGGLAYDDMPQEYEDDYGWTY